MLQPPPPSTLWPTLRWSHSAPAYQGVSAETLREMVAHLQRAFPPFAGVLVARNGHIIFEAENEQARTSRASSLVRGFFAGAAKIAKNPSKTFIDREGDTWNMHSVTNSILSLLVGIAFKKGLLSNLEDAAFDYLPETRSMKFSAAKRAITLRHLLTMTSGLHSIDTGLQPLRLLLSRNWLSTCLRLPLQERPGTRPRYNSANTHLLSAILARVSGLPTADFAQRYLFAPLGISSRNWETDPHGVSFGSGNLFLSLEDMARIGYLVLNNGYWESDTILPDWYLQGSLRKQQSFGFGFSYGFLWYLREETWHGQPIQVISASGIGGQRIFIVPVLNLIVAIVSRTDFAADRSYLLNQAFADTLLPAVSKK